MNIVLFGFCSGSAVLISQYWGAKDRHNIRRTYGLALLCSLAVAAVYTAVAVLFPAQLIGLFTNERAVIDAGAQYLRIAALNTLPLTYAMQASASTAQSAGSSRFQQPRRTRKRLHSSISAAR